MLLYGSICSDVPQVAIMPLRDGPEIVVINFASVQKDTSMTRRLTQKRCISLRDLE